MSEGVSQFSAKVLEPGDLDLLLIVMTAGFVQFEYFITVEHNSSFSAQLGILPKLAETSFGKFFFQIIINW